MPKNIKHFTSIFFLTAFSLVSAQELAFPTAEGFGKFATGGREGVLYRVTNLNDQGEGSLRNGIKQKKARIIVFDVAGTIFLESAISVNYGDLTILGQTAPAPGITISGYPFEIQSDNVIVRYMTIKLGDINKVEGDALECKDTRNVILDHLSIGWGVDENASFYRNQNFTIQWCSVSESLNNSLHKKGAHGYGGIWGGRQVSFHHNFLACNASRNPRFCGSRAYLRNTDEHVSFYNNVVYNWSEYAVYGGEAGTYNIINNMFVPGPATAKSKRAHFLTPYEPYGGYYVAGNHLWGNEAVNIDNTKGVNIKEIESVWQSEPYPMLDKEFIEPTFLAFEKVLRFAGNSINRDKADLRIFSYLIDNTKPQGIGIIDSQEQVGGWETNQPFIPKIDSDLDGMPDAWEISHDLDPNTYNPMEKQCHPYYTNIEVYSQNCINL